MKTFQKTILLIMIFIAVGSIGMIIKKSINLDICLDSGICSENLKLNTEYGEVLINKENCLKYNWKWNDKRRDCDLRD